MKQLNIKNLLKYFMKIISLMILTTLAIVSCDQSSEYYFKVRNNLPNNRIKVNAWTRNYYISYEIPINTIIKVYQMNGALNKTADDIYKDTIFEFDSLKVYKIDSGNLIESKKNFRSRQEWTFHNEGEWKGIYTLSIETSDF